MVSPARRRDAVRHLVGRFLPAAYPNRVWSYDFTSGRTRGGGPIRILNVVDEYTRLAAACRVDRSIGARHVKAELEELFRRRSKPRILRLDNGREFIAATLQEWLGEQGVQPAFIEKGSPQQDPYVERFNGTMPDEVLRGEDFDSVLEARVVLQGWVEEYNERRPHQGLGLLTPRQFVARWKAGTE